MNSSYSDIQIITKLNVIHVLRSQSLLRLQDHTTQPTCILSTQVQFIHVKSIVTVHILQTHNTYINHRYTKLNLFQTHTFVFSNLSLKATQFVSRWSSWYKNSNHAQHCSKFALPDKTNKYDDSFVSFPCCQGTQEILLPSRFVLS